MTNNSQLEKIPPIFISCCNQNPVTINPRKLIDSHHTNIQITTTQIAYLLALIEAKTKNFDSIKLDDHHLQIRVQELRNCLSIILEERICQYLRCSSDVQSIPQSFWIKKWNHKQDDNKAGAPEYLLSWSTTRKLLLQTRESVYINAEHLNTIIKTQKKTEETERKSKLERLNLMDELSANLSHYCTNSPVKLNLKQLPNKIWLKFLAGYLAISSKEYPHYGALEPLDNALINHIKHIHSNLLKSLSKKLEFSLIKLELMSAEQHQIAKGAGIIDIALVAYAPSVEVTKELAFALMKDQSEFDYLFKKTEKQDIDTLIDTALNSDLELLIKNTFPDYKGSHATKASEPHRLVIRVIVIMIQLGKKDITWIPVKQFIEEHISGNHERQTLTKLDEISDDYIIVSGAVLDKKTPQKKLVTIKEHLKFNFIIKKFHITQSATQCAQYIAHTPQ